MTSGFLERFKASIQQKNGLYDAYIPVNKEINPAHIHSTDIKGLNKSLGKNSLSFSQKKSFNILNNQKKSNESLMPLFNSISLNKSKKPTELPQLHNIKSKSKESMRKKRIISINNSYESTPINKGKLTAENLDSYNLPYTPYSLQDYQKINTGQYMVLGGLGANIGNTSWKKANEKKQKMIDYWKIIKQKKSSIS
jgi:hypothetical protein